MATTKPGRWVLFFATSGAPGKVSTSSTLDDRDKAIAAAREHLTGKGYKDLVLTNSRWEADRNGREW